MLIASQDKSLIDNLKVQLNYEFEMKDLGTTKKILGMEVQRDRKTRKLFLSQKKYIEKMHDWFDIGNCKHVYFNLFLDLCPKTKEEKESIAHIPYSTTIGILIYAMVYTRPDLAYAISMVSRYMHNPRKEHYDTVKWILRYLNGTSNIVLVFDNGKLTSNDVVGFTDSNYSGDLDCCRSLSSYIFTFGELFSSLL